MKTTTAHQPLVAFLPINKDTDPNEDGDEDEDEDGVVVVGGGGGDEGDEGDESDAGDEGDGAAGDDGGGDDGGGSRRHYDRDLRKEMDFKACNLCPKGRTVGAPSKLVKGPLGQDLSCLELMVLYQFYDGGDDSCFAFDHSVVNANEASPSEICECPDLKRE